MFSAAESIDVLNTTGGQLGLVGVVAGAVIAIARRYDRYRDVSESTLRAENRRLHDELAALREEVATERAARLHDATEFRRQLTEQAQTISDLRVSLARRTPEEPPS